MTVSEPVLSAVVVSVPSALMPRPAPPVTLMVMVPPLCVKSPSALKPVAYDGSLRSLRSMAPLAFSSMVPPLTLMLPSLFTHFEAMASVVMVSVPPSIYTLPVSSSSWSSVMPVGVVPPRSHCMPSSAVPLMLTVPLFIWKYSSQLMPSPAAEVMLSVRFLMEM